MVKACFRNVLLKRPDRIVLFLFLPFLNQDYPRIFYITLNTSSCTQADIWALGILTYESLMGNPPFMEDNEEDTIQAIVHDSPKFPDWLSGNCVDFINKVAAYVATPVVYV